MTSNTPVQRLVVCSEGSNLMHARARASAEACMLLGTPPDTSSCRSCGHCPSCGKHSGCRALKLRSSTSMHLKEPSGQSTKLDTPLPDSSSVCKAGRAARGSKDSILLLLRSRCLHIQS